MEKCVVNSNLPVRNIGENKAALISKNFIIVLIRNKGGHRMRPLLHYHTDEILVYLITRMFCALQMCFPLGFV